MVEAGYLHRHRHAVVADLPPGQLYVLPLEGILHIGHRDAAGRHVGGAQPHIHDLSQVTGEGHLAHPVHQAQGVDQHAVDVVCHGGAVHLGAAEVEPDSHVAVAVVLGDHGLVRLVRELGPGAGDGVTHIRGALQHVPAELELHRDGGAPLAGHRVDVLDAADAGELILDGLGDLALHHLGGGPLIGGGDGDGRRLHVRHLPHRQLGEGHQAEYGEQGTDDDRHQGAAH
ncbi:hypothetical protein D3C85_1040410 [compost metagenome]